MGRFRSSGSGCINNPDKWTFEVSEDQIKFGWTVIKPDFELTKRAEWEPASFIF